MLCDFCVSALGGLVWVVVCMIAFEWVVDVVLLFCLDLGLRMHWWLDCSSGVVSWCLLTVCLCWSWFWCWFGFGCIIGLGEFAEFGVVV